MIWLLLLANVAMVFVVIGAAAARPSVSGRRDRPANLDVLLTDAHSKDSGRTARALIALSSRPVDGAAALPTALWLAGHPDAIVAHSAAILIERVLARQPELLALCWPAGAPLARQAVVGSVPSVESAPCPGDPRSVAVRDASVDADAGVRRQAARCLAWLGPESLDAAEHLTRDADAEVRRLAYAHLGAAGAASHVARLVERLATAGAIDGLPALEALADAGRRHPLALEHLAMSSTDAATRVAATRALGATGRSASARALIDVVRDARSELRRAAALALTDLAPSLDPESRREVCAALVAQLRHESSVSVTLALLDAAEAYRPAEGAAVIGARLDSLHPAIRARAREVVGELARPLGANP
jgi:hypothetical protein